MRTMIVVITLALLLMPGIVLAQGEEWDRSSIALTGACLGDGLAQFVVVNNGRDMAGPSNWRRYENDLLVEEGTFQLVAMASQTWTFTSLGVAVRFEADQRVGHRGNSAPKLELTCEAITAVNLRTFSAASGKLLLAACQKGVVTDFLDAPGGHIVYVLREGKAFNDAYFTVRHFRVTQRVKVCAGVVG